VKVQKQKYEFANSYQKGNLKSAVTAPTHPYEAQTTKSKIPNKATRE